MHNARSVEMLEEIQQREAHGFRGEADHLKSEYHQAMANRHIQDELNLAVMEETQRITKLAKAEIEKVKENKEKRYLEMQMEYEMHAEKT